MSMIHDITAAVPRYKQRTRKGRGEGSGQGKTAGRGTKGLGARSGKPIKPAHEGGQTPTHRQLPTRGFSNFKFRTNWYIVNVSDLERFEDGATVDTAALVEAGLVRDAKYPVKVLGNGALGKKLTVMAGWYSRSAHQKISEAGGTAQNSRGETFEFPKPKKRFVKRPKDQPAPAAS